MTTTLTRLAHRHRGRADDERGIALMSAILLIGVVSMLAILMLGLILAELRPTLYANKNSRTVSAAQAGVDAAISQIRNAITTDGAGNEFGDIHQLPCTVSGPVEGTSGQTSFTAQVSYFVDDPTGKDEAWRTANALTCYTGTGNNGGVRAVPRHAIISSSGVDATATVMASVANRSIEATYTFPLTTQTISGGAIMDGNVQYCLVADSATAGSNIRYQPAGDEKCSAASDTNRWSWRNDYMIHLSSTDLGGKIPLCLTGRNTGNSKVPMTLQPCTADPADPLGQRFSWTGQHTWRGQNDANTAGIDSYITNENGTVSTGDRISVSRNTTPPPVPLPAVGKGNASYQTNQVVNQSQFGRCLDVTDGRIARAYMIAYPCKQDPSGNGSFDWNHKWFYTEVPDGQESVTTTIRVNHGTDYCLITTAIEGLVAGTVPPDDTALGSRVGENAPHRFPRFLTSGGGVNCSSVQTKWTRFGETGDITTSWTFQDSNGRCLSANGPLFGSSQWSSIVVETCNGSDLQKWNVPDDPVEAVLGDFVETTGQGSG